MLNIKKVLTIAISVIFLSQGAVFCATGKDFLLRPPSHFSKPTAEFIKNQQGLTSKTDPITSNKTANRSIIAKAVDKFERKVYRAKSIGLPMALIVLNMLGAIQQPLAAEIASFNTQSQQSGPVVAGQREILQAVDQWNSPPQWMAYYIDHGEKGSVDISGFRTLRLRVQGQGNVIAQLIDVNRRNEGGNWQHGLSKVYSIKPGQEFIDIDISEFRDSDPSLKLTEINKIIVHAGEKAWEVPLNKRGAKIRVLNAEFARDRVAKSEGVSIPEHINNLERIQGERKTSLLKVMQNQVLDTGEFKILTKGLFDERIKIVNVLKDMLSAGSGRERVMALSQLRYALMDPSQNTNIRRYIYYIFKDVIKTEIRDEDLLPDFVVKGPRVTDPVAVSFPMIWYVEAKKLELREFPDWKGEIEMRRFNDKGTTYGVEGVITDKKTVIRIVDRGIMKRLAYWSIAMGIDPMKLTLPTVYTESLLGAHPEKFDNIMAIHVQDLENALDKRGKDMREKLLAFYGGNSQDQKLDKVIVTGLVILAQGVNAANSSNLADLAQRYNGTGLHPWLYNPDGSHVDMSKNPIIGKRVVDVGNWIAGGILADIVSEAAKELGLALPVLPKNLSGYKIDILRNMRSRESLPSHKIRASIDNSL